MDNSDIQFGFLRLCVSGLKFSKNKFAPINWAVVLAALIVPVSAFSLSPNEVFRIAAPSVVSVVSVKSSQEVSLGSGVVIRANVVATNCHVVDSASKLVVKQEGDLLEASILAEDQNRDLCLLKILSDRLKPATIADLKPPQPGDRVYAIGSPRGLEKTISEGLIGGIRLTENGQIIQTSAAISQGSSGGGLFDAGGLLVGLTTFSYRDSQNLNFAIPASAVRNLLDDTDRKSGNLIPEETGERLLKDSVVSALASAAPPVPEFSSVESRLAYLKWINSASDRLKPRIVDVQTRVDFLQTVYYESARAGLDVGLVLGLIETSSGFRKFEINSTGARGYMQVATVWPKKIGDGDVGKLFHAQTNLRYGCVLLRHFLDLSGGDVRYALIKYHAQIRGRKYSLKNRESLSFSVAVIKSMQSWNAN